MALLTSLRAALHAIIWIAVIAVAQDHQDEGGDVEQADPERMVVTFVNEMPDVNIELFWEGEGQRRTEGTVDRRGGFITVETSVGHEFSYDLNGSRHYLTPPPPNADGRQFVTLAGHTEPDGFIVKCPLQQTAEYDNLSLDFTVRPYWAARGASRFLDLVRNKYFDGVALNRVVPEFLTQFGIARDHEQKMLWDELTISDDRPFMEFEPGYVSFAGSGPDSRTTEIFIVMPGTSDEQLEYFGENSWETPFAVLQDLDVMTKIYSGYGDMPPWGEGPDSDKIYQADGYEYLASNFPKLTYIERCYIVGEESTVEAEL